MFVTLINSYSGDAKRAKIGFSWTTFFFGFFPALFRGDFKWFAIIALLEIVSGSFTMGIAMTLVTLIFGFIYNGLYIKDLLSHGYAPASEADAALLRAKGFRFYADKA